MPEVTIYKIVNPLGQHYIGQTSTSLRRRKVQHKTDFNGIEAGKHWVKTHPLLHDSFKKYGFDCHVFELICFCSKANADKTEQRMVRKYKSFVDKGVGGLNATAGGKFTTTYSKDTVSKICEHHGRRRLVHQFDRDGNFLKEYDSIKEATIGSHTCYTVVLSCLKGRVDHAKGFVWKYADNKPGVKNSTKLQQTPNLVDGGK